ncbi:hypothetical protein D1007_27246 [Hordeum vulgare]|nr:hypothetical protein D1007_27246 [Hordeum vulgare]
MVGSSTSSSSRFSGTTPSLTIVKAEPQETSEQRRNRGSNLIINEGHRQPSPSCGHLRLVKPKKEKGPATPLVAFKQEHIEMAVDLDTGLK